MRMMMEFTAAGDPSSPSGVGSSVSHWQGLDLQCILCATVPACGAAALESSSYRSWIHYPSQKLPQGSTKMMHVPKDLSSIQGAYHNQKASE